MNDFFKKDQTEMIERLAPYFYQGEQGKWELDSLFSSVINYVIFDKSLSLFGLNIFISLGILDGMIIKLLLPLS